MEKYLRKNFAPPPLTLQKFWSNPLAHWKKNWSPTLTTPKNYGPPTETDGPLLVKYDSSQNSPCFAWYPYEKQRLFKAESVIACHPI